MRLGHVGFLVGLRLDSTKTASWSEIPGMTLVWFTRVSLLVKKSSRILALVLVVLVGSVTIWLRKASLLEGKFLCGRFLSRLLAR